MVSASQSLVRLSLQEAEKEKSGLTIRAASCDQYFVFGWIHSTDVRVLLQSVQLQGAALACLHTARFHLDCLVHGVLRNEFRPPRYCKTALMVLQCSCAVFELWLVDCVSHDNDVAAWRHDSADYCSS
eukprot:6216964-Amphidinium_carterae.1